MSNNDIQYYPDFTEDLEYSGKTGDEAIEAIKKDLDEIKDLLIALEPPEETIFAYKLERKPKERNQADKIIKILDCATGRIKPKLNRIALQSDNWTPLAGIARLLGYQVEKQSEKTALNYPWTRQDGLMGVNKQEQLAVSLIQESENAENDQKTIITNIRLFLGYIFKKNNDFFTKEGSHLLELWKGSNHEPKPHTYNLAAPRSYFLEWAIKNNLDDLPLLKAYPDGFKHKKAIPIQEKRLKVLEQWITENKIDVSKPLDMKNKKLWEELNKIDPNLFGTFNPSAMSKLITASPLPPSKKGRKS